MDPDVFFTEPHYNGFPAILVRLAADRPGMLEKLLTDALADPGSEAARSASSTSARLRRLTGRPEALPRPASVIRPLARVRRAIARFFADQLERGRRGMKRIA